MTKLATHVMNVQSLRFDRTGKVVLDNVHLTASTGEWTAMIGPNGAGKSTLLRLMAGLESPQSGRIDVDGQGLSTRTAGDRSKLISWLGQQHEGDEAMQVRDLVRLGRMPHLGWMGLGAFSKQDHEAVERALVDTDMASMAERAVGQLSSGERQRVALSRALAVQAPILLLDEPVAHLDAPHQRALAQVLRREAQRGRCVVSVLHELPLAMRADRIVVLHQGQVLAQGAATDPVVHRAIEHVFDDAVRIVSIEDQWTVMPRF